MLKEEKVKRTLQLIEDYLFGNLEHGFWVDFTACHGGSTSWTTSYVARHLAENSKNLERLAPIKDKIIFNQRKDGGWAYNHTAVSDSDTTANCLSFLHNFQGTQETIEEGIEFLLKHQNRENGGFSTYREDNLQQYVKALSLDGWCSPNIESTASAVNTLIKIGYERDEIKKALNFIASNQKEDGSWEPYWWSSREYITSEAIDSLGEFPNYKKNVKCALEYLTDKRRNLGWVNDFSKKYSPFYAALSLGALSINNIKIYGLASRYQINEKFIPELLEIEMNMLIDTQNSDGSFGPDFIFRIPRYDIANPSQIKKWNIEIPHENSVYKDDNRFFTTAAVYSTLLKYLRN